MYNGERVLTKKQNLIERSLERIDSFIFCIIILSQKCFGSRRECILNAYQFGKRFKVLTKSLRYENIY